MKPNKQLRIKYHVDYSDQSDFSSKARLLQSIWREDKGLEFDKYGNFLKIDFAKQTGANFLTESIFKIVKYEVEKAKKQDKVISEPRIWNNLLSSQPLAFNLFGELKLNKTLATNVLKELYPDLGIEGIVNIEFEHSPGRRNIKYTGDSSAFDVFIEYSTGSALLSFLGIEVKYAEHLKDKPSSHKERYEEISIESGLFDLSQLGKLKEKPIQQIWRDHLLALSLFISNTVYERGDFVYLFPSGNTECINAIEKYELTFLKKNDYYFKALTIEKFIKVLKKKSKENWIYDFEERYLNFTKIEETAV